MYASGDKQCQIGAEKENEIDNFWKLTIKEYDGVEDAVVFGIPSQTYGEDICVAVKMTDGKEVVNQPALKKTAEAYDSAASFLSGGISDERIRKD